MEFDASLDVSYDEAPTWKPQQSRTPYLLSVCRLLPWLLRFGRCTPLPAHPSCNLHELPRGPKLNGDQRMHVQDMCGESITIYGPLRSLCVQLLPQSGSPLAWPGLASNWKDEEVYSSHDETVCCECILKTLIT